MQFDGCSWGVGRFVMLVLFGGVENVKRRCCEVEL